jgi:hypothetical protein
MSQPRPAHTLDGDRKALSAAQSLWSGEREVHTVAI